MFKVLDEVYKPKRATKYSSCVDLFAREDVVVSAGETKIVPLGVKIDLIKLKFQLQKDNDGLIFTEYDFLKFLLTHCLELKCRSSLPLKKGLIMANGVGEIDLDYPDEIGILLHNPIKFKNFSHAGAGIALDTLQNCEIKKGEKIAQIKLVEHKSYLMGYESEEVRDGGFGSTDKFVVLNGSTPGKTKYEDIAHISSMLDDVAFQEAKMEDK